MVTLKMAADSKEKKEKEPKAEQALLDEDDDFEEFVTEGEMWSFMYDSFPFCRSGSRFLNSLRLICNCT